MAEPLESRRLRKALSLWRRRLLRRLVLVNQPKQASLLRNRRRRSSNSRLQMALKIRTKMRARDLVGCPSSVLLRKDNPSSPFPSRPRYYRSLPQATSSRLLVLPVFNAPAEYTFQLKSMSILVLATLLHYE